jgi:hypothetical protein
VFFGTEFILISLVSLSVTSTKRLGGHFENFGFVIFTCIEGGKGGGMDHVSQRKKKPFHDSRVLKKQFHGKVDSNKII